MLSPSPNSGFKCRSFRTLSMSCVFKARQHPHVIVYIENIFNPRLHRYKVYSKCVFSDFSVPKNVLFCVLRTFLYFYHPIKR